MIKEYGIDPEILDSSASFYMVTQFFGMKHFRLIRNFPEDWSAIVRKSFKKVKPKERLRLFERLEQLNAELLKCSSTYGAITFSYDSKSDWYNNAQRYHVINPFDGIVCEKNPNHDVYINRPDELKEDEGILNIPSEIQRDSKQIALSVKTIFLYADQIHLIDPYFASIELRFLRPLKEMISFFDLRKSMNLKIPSRFVFHTSTDHKGDAFIEEHLKRELAPYLLNSITLEVIRWPEDELHSRAVISDIGGVVFQIGLDDTDDYAIKEKDNLKPYSSVECKCLSARKTTSEKYMYSTKTPSIIVKGRK